MMKISRKFFCEIKNFKLNIFSKINTLKDKNLIDYYTRRYEYDFINNTFESFSKEELEKELIKIENIIKVQNTFFSGNSVLESDNKI